VLFTGFDCEACLNFYRQAMPTLVQRVRNGEALLTLVPLSGGEIPNGDAAARAALCAGEQNAFWRYHDLLYGWAETHGPDAFASERLIGGVTELELDRITWDTCMLSTFPGLTLDVAINSSQSQVGFSGLPSVYVNSEAVPADISMIDAAIVVEAARINAQIQQAVGATNTPSVDSTFDPESTEPVVVTLPPVETTEFPPPLTITLPEGWRTIRQEVLVLGDVDAVRRVPFTVWGGPVSEGVGVITLLWGFPNLIAGNPFEAATVQPDLFADGQRLLRLAIIEQGCNIGSDLRREYSIGGLTAIGTQFSAVTCPELQDTRGWYAGLQQNGLNFIFYVYAYPIATIDSARSELQAILDSVRFNVP
jgi:hypothetical protein